MLIAGYEIDKDMNWIHLPHFLQIPKYEMKDPKVPARYAFDARSLGKIMQQNELFLLSHFAHPWPQEPVSVLDL